jgi:hypothetical protein
MDKDEIPNEPHLSERDVILTLYLKHNSNVLKRKILIHTFIRVYQSILSKEVCINYQC